MVRLAFLSALIVGLPLAAQPKTEAEAFAFDPQPKTLVPARPFWWHVAASPDGRTFVTAHAVEGGGEWWAWDAVTGVVVDRVREPNVVRFIDFSPDGSLVATANFDNTNRIYDATSHRLLASGNSSSGGHSGGVNALAFSRDGKHLATAGLDKTARVWDVAEGSASPGPARGRRQWSWGSGSCARGCPGGVRRRLKPVNGRGDYFPVFGVAVSGSPASFFCAPCRASSSGKP